MVSSGVRTIFRDMARAYFELIMILTDGMQISRTHHVLLHITEITPFQVTRVDR
jgi:hypothetical protein